MDGKAGVAPFRKNGRNPDIVSAYSYNTGITIATGGMPGKSNEIKAVPILIDKIDISRKDCNRRCHVNAKDIIERIRTKGGDFLIELKANQRSLRYGVEDSLKGTYPFVFIY